MQGIDIKYEKEMIPQYLSFDKFYNCRGTGFPVWRLKFAVSGYCCN